MKRFAWVIITTSAGKGAIDLCWCHILCCFSPWVIMLPHCSSSQLHFSVSCPVEMSSTLLSEHKLTRVWAFVKVHTFSSPLLSYIWVRDQSRGERQRDQCCKYLAKYSQVCVYSALDLNTFLTPSPSALFLCSGCFNFWCCEDISRWGSSHGPSWATGHRWL